MKSSITIAFFAGIFGVQTYQTAQLLVRLDRLIELNAAAVTPDINMLKRPLSTHPLPDGNSQLPEGTSKALAM